MICRVRRMNGVIRYQMVIVVMNDFNQENIIQKWTLTTQIQTTAMTNNPRNKNTN